MKRVEKKSEKPKNLVPVLICGECKSILFNTANGFRCTNCEAYADLRGFGDRTGYTIKRWSP